MTYSEQPWFTMLQNACKQRPRQTVAAELGVSPATVSQVLNGSGKYGTGEAGTKRLSERVLHTYGRWECPHLTQRNGESTVLSPEQCRAFAHREPPVGSPLAMQHWQACNACPHKPLTAPVTARPPIPRKPRALKIEKD